MTKDLQLLSGSHLVEFLADEKFLEALDRYQRKGAIHRTAAQEQAA